jgi:hypothetical protein
MRNRVALKLTDTDSAPPSAALDMSDTWRSNSLTKPARTGSSWTTCMPASEWPSQNQRQVDVKNRVGRGR